MKKPENIYKQK